MESNHSFQDKEIIEINNVLNQNHQTVLHESCSPLKLTTIHGLHNLVIINALKKINRTTLNVLQESIMLFKHLEKIQKNPTNNTDLDNNKSDKLQKLSNVILPLTSEEELHLFEEQLLNNKDAKNKMVVKMAHLAQNNIDDTVRAMLKFMFSDKLLQEYSYKGPKIKKAFSSLYSCSLIFDAIRRIKKFKNVATIDIEKPLKTFIAGAKLRKRI